jgi:hypothetical protein
MDLILAVDGFVAVETQIPFGNDKKANADSLRE